MKKDQLYRALYAKYASGLSEQELNYKLAYANSVDTTSFVNAFYEKYTGAPPTQEQMNYINSYLAEPVKGTDIKELPTEAEQEIRTQQDYIDNDFWNNSGVSRDQYTQDEQGNWLFDNRPIDEKDPNVQQIINENKAFDNYLAIKNRNLNVSDIQDKINQLELNKINLEKEPGNEQKIIAINNEIKSLEQKQQKENIAKQDELDKKAKEQILKETGDEDLLSSDDEDVANKLAIKYTKYGFTFSAPRDGQNVVIVSHPNADEPIEVRTSSTRFEVNSLENKKLKDYLNKHATHSDSTSEALEKKLILNDKELEQKRIEGEKSIIKNINEKKFEEWFKENRDRLNFPLKRQDLPQPPPQEYIDIANEYFGGDIEYMYDFLYSGSRSTGVGGGFVPKQEETDLLRGSENVFDADKADTSRKQDIESAIYEVAARRLNAKKNTNFSSQDLATKYTDEFKEIVDIVRDEWENLTSTGTEEEIKQSDVYKSASNFTRDTLSAEQVKKNVKDFVEAFSEDIGKGEAQEFFAKELQEKSKELSEKAKQIELENKIIGEQSEYLQNKIEVESKWLKENEKKLVDELKSITSKKYNTDEARNKAEVRVNEIKSELRKHYNAFNKHAQDLNSLAKAAISLQKDAKITLKSDSDVRTLGSLMSKKYGWVDQTVYSLTNATIDLLQGIATAVEATVYFSIPTGFLADYLIEKTTHPTVKTFANVAKSYGLLGSGRFDNDANTTSITQHLHQSLDAWQKKWGDTIEEPPKYDDIDSLSDFGEWFGVMLSGQIPQLALMVATGGQSAWLQTAILAGSAGGQKFMGMEEDKELFLKTGGLYGQDYDFLQMYLSSAAVGIAEGLSERITFGQLKGVAKALKGNKAASAGFAHHLYNVAIKQGGLRRGSVDLLEEGSSEAMATISENFIDYLNGGEAGIFDNVEESFVSGLLISSTIKTPLVFNEMYKPFQSPNTKAQIDAKQDRIDSLLQNVISLGRPGREKEFDAAKAEMEKLVVEQKALLEQDIRRVDSLTDSEKTELLDIRKRQRQVELEIKETLKREDLDIAEKDAIVRELNNEIIQTNKTKQDILGKHDITEVDNRYRRIMRSVRARAKEFALASGLQVNITEGNSNDAFDFLANSEGYNVNRNENGDVETVTISDAARQRYIDDNKSILADPNASKELKKAARQNIKLLESGKEISMSPDQFFQLNGSKNNFGIHIPKFENGKFVGHNIFVNKSTAHDEGKFSTGAHELLHGILYETLQRDLDVSDALTKTFISTLKSKGVKVPPALMQTIETYAREEGRAEEIMTLVSEAFIDGEIKLPKTALGGVKNFFRRWSMNKVDGRDISFDTDQDVINFIKDYSYSIKNNRQNRAITRMFTSGVKGDLIKKQQELRDERNKNKEKPAEAAFSKNVDELLSDNPDLLTEIDSFVKNPDGTQRYKTKKEFQDSSNFVDAWNLITNSNKLDGLIKAGIIAEGINTPQAIGEFTRKVKDKLGERLLANFDPAKNNSLFGWLTGVSGGAGKSIIYRAKGDVMVEYKRQVQTTSADAGVTAEAGAVDPQLEALENEVIIAGTNTRVNKNQTDIIFLESVNAAKTKKAVDNIIEKAGVNLEKLTYSGTKKLLVQHDGSKPKSKRKPTGPLYSALQSVSNLFGVDASRIVKEQDLTGSQRTIAREFIKNNAKQLIDMLPEGENRSGDATGVANTVLGNFYIKGDRISMRESGTGKGKPSQTKRDNITTKEFIDFFNKQGTKSDGAIRALIVQAATISANQSIRQTAIQNETDPINKIALVGDGKSLAMFSKNVPSLQAENLQVIGGITRTLSPNASIKFWDQIYNFATQNILPTDLDSIKIALQNTYTDSEILSNVTPIAKTIQSFVKTYKPDVVNNPVELSAKLVSSNLAAEVQVKESSNSTMDNAEAYRVEQRRNELKAVNIGFANSIYDPNNPEESIAKILMLKDHLGNASSTGYIKRSQIFKGNVDFIPELIEKIPDVEKVNTTVSAKGGVTINSITLKNGKVIKPSKIRSAQTSVNVYQDMQNNNLDTRDVNENLAQDLLNDYVAYTSKLFKEGKIDNVHLMMIKSGLLSGMNTMLARAGKVQYMSDKAKAEIERALKAKKLSKIDLKAIKDGEYDNELSSEARDALIRQIKSKIEAQVRYEHMPSRVLIINSMYDAHINGNGISNVRDYLKEYKVQVITQDFDKVIADAKLGNALLEGTNINTEDVGIMRNYNDRTIDDSRVESIRDIRTNEVIVPSEAHVKTNQMLDKTRKQQAYMSKAVDNSRAIDENTTSRGMSTFDFDETLIIEGENFVTATGPDGDVVQVSSGKWPVQGPKLTEQGYKFNFDDFVKVRGGKEGPLLQKMKNQIKKFGVDNVFVLTARPQASDTAIQGWLKSKGINLPLKNITGLANSTGEAKALWMLEKFSEGYNDMYFVDDALSNVDAVKNVLEQLDIKSKVVQARIQFSKNIQPTFNSILDSNVDGELDINRIIEQSTGVKAEAQFSDAQAKIRGSKKGKFSFFVPPSAEDFKGLIYRFLSKGRDGERQLAFFKKALFDPFNRAYQRMNATRQQLENGYRALLKQFSNVKKNLNNDIGNGFTLDQAIRAYLFDKAGFNVPGVSKRDLNFIKKHVEGDSDILAFANSFSALVNQPDGYLEPTEFWLAETTASDINKINVEISRDEALQEFKQNRAKMFGEWQGNRLVGPTMNKIEAIYGTRFREALEDILYRMEYGKRRESGSNRLVNAFNNWANQSVGAIMFFNMRSALLQTISAVNYLNWSDNNPLKAGAALANFPQFIKDFVMIFNSDMLKQRRGGQQRGINEAELAETLSGSKNRVKQMLHYLLTKGFLPTQIADSFAIASGGALMYRNRVKSYLKQGLTQSQAEQRAFQDFQEITEEGQQSARPDMISQQQASPLGRYILAFKNTPMQYARLMKKAILDLGAGRGDFKTNVSKIIYYGGIQNLIFNGLQAALGSLVGDDDDEEDKTRKKERVVNGMIDSVLGGLGFAGNVTVTVKNSLMEYLRQRERGWNADHTYTMLTIASLSPTIGSKLRRIYTGIQTEKFNRDVIKEMGVFNIDNPAYGAIANVISGVTNLPLDRLIKKIDNIDAALTENITPIEKLALIMGWNTWDLGIEDQDIIAVENEIKEKKDAERKEKQKQKREEQKIKKQEENLKLEEENRKKEDDRCIAINREGNRCKNKAVANGYCTIHAKVEQGDKEVRCKKIKSDGKRCKMMTKAKSGLCYYHD